MVLSHGWVDLPPYEWDRQENRLRMVIRTRRDRVFALEIQSLKDCRPGQGLSVQKIAGPRLSKADLAILEERIRWCFRLDTDFRPFQAICAKTKGFGWVKKHGLGPLLRTPDLFEEFVKILMTTNITWSGTKLMT